MQSLSSQGTGSRTPSADPRAADEAVASFKLWTLLWTGVLETLALVSSRLCWGAHGRKCALRPCCSAPGQQHVWQLVQVSTLSAPCWECRLVEQLLPHPEVFCCHRLLEHPLQCQEATQTLDQPPNWARLWARMSTQHRQICGQPHLYDASAQQLCAPELCF
jgi:hypothetical protein